MSWLLVDVEVALYMGTRPTKSDVARGLQGANVDIAFLCRSSEGCRGRAVLTSFSRSRRLDLQRPCERRAAQSRLRRIPWQRHAAIKTVFFLGDFSVFLAATVAVFLIDEQDKPKRTTLVETQRLSRPSGFEGVDAGTVVVAPSPMSQSR